MIHASALHEQAETARSLVHPKAQDFEPATLDVPTTKKDPEKSKRLLDAGRQATNAADREKNFRDMQWRMHEEALMQPAAHSRLFLVAKKSIKDVRSHGIYSAALYKGST